MTTPIYRRLNALEIASDTVSDNDEPAVWGPGFDNLPAMTKGELKRMLRTMHDTGSGKLPISPPRQAGV